MNELTVELIFKDATPNKIVTYPTKVGGRDANNARPISMTVHGVIDTYEKWDWLHKSAYMHLKPMVRSNDDE